MVTLTIRAPPKSATQSNPPELAMPRAPLTTVKGVATPAGVMRRTLSALAVQRLPSGPVTIVCAVAMSAGKPTAPAGSSGAKRETSVAFVTHMFPSGPAVMPIDPSSSATSNSVTTPAGVTRATSMPSAPPASVTHMFPSGPCATRLASAVRSKTPSTLGAAMASGASVQ